MTTPYESLLAECQEANPNHHLWNNNGTWWFHCTVHRPDYTKERIRRSLETSDLTVAKQRRDLHLRELASRTDVRLSIRSSRRSSAEIELPRRHPMVPQGPREH